MKKVGFENGSFYHVYNRGVDKRRIFMEDQDYSYFLYELSEFNNPIPSYNLKRNLNTSVRGSTSNTEEGFVEVCCFVLMPNHYHLILRQIKDKGTIRLMQRLGTGYTIYFNKKYERAGSLFEGRYRAKPIESDEYLMHLSRYIHLNPVSIISPEWKDKGIKAWKKTNEYLKSYKWSSYHDYLGLDCTSRVVQKDFIMDYFKNSSQKYEKFVTSWTKDENELIVRGSTSNNVD